MNLNRSKSSNLLYYPSTLQYFNCQDIQQSQQIEQIRGNMWKHECVDLGWIKIFEDKDKSKKNSKIGKKRQKQNYLSKQVTKQKPFNLLTDSSNFRQKTVSPTVKFNQQQNLSFCQPHRKLIKPLPSNFFRTSPAQLSLNKQNTYNSIYNQESTRQQQQKSMSMVKNKSQNGQKCRQFQQNTDKKMLEYSIQIDRLNYDIQRLKQEVEIEKQKNNKRSLQGSRIDPQYIQQLKHNLIEQIQAKNNIIIQRDMLLTQLSEALNSHQLQTTCLKQKTNSLESQLTYYQNLTSQQQSQITSLKNLLNQNQQQIKQQKNIKQKLTTKLKLTLIDYEELQIQYIKIQKQNKQLTNHIKQIQQKIINQHNQLQEQYNRNFEYIKILQNKDKQIDILNNKIYIIQTNNLQVNNKLQQITEQLQQLKKYTLTIQQNIKQLKLSQNNKTEQIINLQQIIRSLQSTIHQASLQLQAQKYSNCQQNQIYQQYQQIQRQAQTQIQNISNFIPQVLQLLNIKQQLCESDILIQIENIVFYNKYYKQIYNDYRQILDMFNISIKHDLCHQKLISQILEFRNNMGVLVKKIKTMEKELYSLNQENKKLYKRNKNQYHQAIIQLDRIVQQQNQQIVRYRLQMKNSARRKQ